MEFALKFTKKPENFGLPVPERSFLHPKYYHENLQPGVARIFNF